MKKNKIFQPAFLLFSLLVAASCGIFYELLLSTVSSYFLGSAVLHFSLTIGLFLSFMGVGAFLAQFIKNEKSLLPLFIWVEIFLGIVGGFSVLILFYAFSMTDWYHLLNFFLIAIIASLMGMEIPILTRVLKHFSSLKSAISNVLSFDYLGALVASVLFPLFLLPLLGTLKTGFFIGIINTFIGIATFWVFRKELKNIKKFMIVSFTSLAFLVFGFFSSFSISSFFEGFLYRDDIIVSDQSKYQKIVLTQSNNDIRLFLNGHLQFSSLDEYRYHESLVHSVMQYAPMPEKVLVLGGGDGMAVREILKYPEVKKVVLVDLDKKITDLAQKNLLLKQLNQDALSDTRVTVINDDALKFLEHSTEDIFSVVIADFPDPSSAEVSKLYSKEFYDLLFRRMSADGVLVTQSTSPFFAHQVFWSINTTLEQVFQHVIPFQVYVPSFGNWGFQIAFKQKNLPVAREIPLDLRFFSSEIFISSQFFGKDVSDIESKVNTLHTPVLPDLYKKDWERWE